MSQQSNQPQYKLSASQRVVDLMARLFLDVQKTSTSPLVGMTAAELMQWLQTEVAACDLEKQRAAADEARKNLQQAMFQQAKQFVLGDDGKKYRLIQIEEELKESDKNG